MKKSRRSIGLLTIVLLILILFSLTGCSNEKTTNNNSVENSLSNEEKMDNILEENNIVNEKVEDLKVGAYTLKYGKYVGTSYEYGTAGNDDGSISTFTNTYILNQDETYSYSSTSGSTDNGTYKVIDLSSVDAYFNGQYGIEFSNGGMLVVPENNTLQVLAGAMEKFIYQDDDNNTTAIKKENNSNTSKTEVSIKGAEAVIRNAFDKSKNNSTDVTVKDIIENLEDGWKILNINLSTNSKQLNDDSKIKDYMLEIVVNDEKNDNSGITSFIILNENSKRQFCVRLRATSDKNINIPAGDTSIYQSYELQ